MQQEDIDLNEPQASAEQLRHFGRLIDFCRKASGYRILHQSEDTLIIEQMIDRRALRICANWIDDILDRADPDGQMFLQVNFADDRKILITDRLIGFKPQPRSHREGAEHAVRRLPRVVTTPDLASVLGAMNESFDRSDERTELATLRVLYDAILRGASLIGFEVADDRRKLLPYLHAEASESSARAIETKFKTNA
jgi:hypothetical protein